MENIEYTKICEELNALVGARFAKFHRLGEKTFRIRLGKASAVFELGVRLHLTDYEEENEENDGLISAVRKKLDNRRFLGAEQKNGDRIVMLKFENADLVLEMFREGNMVIVEEGKTTVAVRQEDWSDRKVRIGEEYRFPRSNTLMEFTPSEKYVVIDLMKLPLGKRYSKEILARAGVEEKTPGNKLSAEQRRNIEREMEKMKKGFQPRIYVKDGKTVDFGLTEFSEPMGEGIETKTTETLSKAADAYYSHLEKLDPQTEKLKEILRQQEETLAKAEKEAVESKEKGDAVYARFQELEPLLKKSLDELEKEMGKPGSKIRKIDKKDKEITVEL